MKGLNKVTLIGNLGKDPETKYLDGNVTLTKFPLATSESYKDKEGQMVTRTEWHNIVLWRGLAEVAGKYLKKGSRVYLEGKIRTRSWEDDNNVKKYITEVAGDNMIMLDGKNDSASTGPVADPPEMTTAPDEDDLPF